MPPLFSGTPVDQPVVPTGKPRFSGTLVDPSAPDLNMAGGNRVGRDQPSPLGAVQAAVGHAASDIPVIGPAAQWVTDNALAQTVGRLSGEDPADWLKRQMAARDANDAANPLAAEGGGIAGNVAAAAATGGASPILSEALGFTGKLLPSAAGLGKVVSSGLSTFGLTAADKMVKGETPVQATEDAVGPALLAAGVPVAAKAAGKVVGAGVDAVNDFRQNQVTNAAIKDAPDAAALRSAGSDLFKSSVDTNPVAIQGSSYNRFLDGVQASLGKYRPNPSNDPQVVGLLSDLVERGKAANTPGTVVDLKDLHLARELANEVAGLPGRQGTMGRIVVDQIDNFIQTLKPGDILGGADPAKATSDLMGGISTWNRATKVGLIQRALTNADAAKRGMESGIQSNFASLMKSDDFNRFSPEEQAAIRTVAKGTTLQNVASLAGTLGIKLGPGGHNVLSGGSAGAVASGALLPVLGLPLAPMVGFGATSAAGAAGRAVAENMATKSANRVARMVATPDIPKVAPWSLPAAAQNAGPFAEQVARGTIQRQSDQPTPPPSPKRSAMYKAFVDAGGTRRLSP